MKTRNSWIVGILVLSLLAGALLGCAERAGISTFHCPMHPTYTASSGGDCPICGMRLVPQAEGILAQARYACPMHPQRTSDEPGRCPECGMPLERVHDSGPLSPRDSGQADDTARAPVTLSPEAFRLAGIQIQIVSRGVVTRPIRSTGTVLADPTLVRHIVSRTSGWIERLNVTATGEWIEKGRPMFTLYAPDLVSVQEEYLRFVRTRDAVERGSNRTAEAQRRLVTSPSGPLQRIERYGLPDTFLQDLERDGTARPSVPFAAPISGFVRMAAIFEGQQVEPGMELLTITDLSQVWVEAAVFESDVARVRPGLSALLSAPYDPGVRTSCRVVNIDPFLDADSRTLKVRLRCPNRGLALKPGMFTSVDLKAESKEGVMVPSTAVVDLGLQQITFVEQPERVFTPRVVEVGLRGEGHVQILAGLEAGERVAVKGNFLLDSESRMQGALTGSQEAKRLREGQRGHSSERTRDAEHGP